MKVKTQREKLLNFGISSLALGIFPLIWFLSQALLFRELTELISRNLLVVVGIIIGSTFIFLLFFGMNKIITFADKDSRDSLEARMFVGPSVFMIGLFLFYPAIRTIFLSFRDRYGTSAAGFDNYLWAFSDPEMIVTIRNQIIWLVFVVTFVLLIGLVVGWLSDRLNKGEAFFKSIVFLPMAISAVGASAIFKFIYEYRPPPLTQIGIINGIRVSVDRANYICANNKDIDGVYRVVGDENCLPPIGWLQQRDMSNLPFVQNLDLDNWFNNIIINIPINTILLMVDRKSVV